MSKVIAPIIYLAAGHGGSDSGAISPNGDKERDQAIVITNAVARILIFNGITVEVEPHNLDTHQSINRINARYPRIGTAWGLELHRDSASTIREPSASFRCGVYTGISSRSIVIGQRMVDAMIDAGAHKTSWNRKHTESPHGSLGWIRQPRVLSMIIEHGFMQGRNDTAHLLKLAEISAAGIMAGYKLD